MGESFRLPKKWQPDRLENDDPGGCQISTFNQRFVNDVAFGREIKRFSPNSSGQSPPPKTSEKLILRDGQHQTHQLHRERKSQEYQQEESMQWDVAEWLAAQNVSSQNMRWLNVTLKGGSLWMIGRIILHDILMK